MPVKKPSDSKAPRQLWTAFFTLWGLFLSGLFSQWTGSPGILQAVQLKAHLDQKKELLAASEAEVASLIAEQKRYREDSRIQELEIRKVLGYAANDEVIFEFSPNR